MALGARLHDAHDVFLQLLPLPMFSLAMVAATAYADLHFLVGDWGGLRSIGPARAAPRRARHGKTRRAARQLVCAPWAITFTCAALGLRTIRAGGAFERVYSPSCCSSPTFGARSPATTPGGGVWPGCVRVEAAVVVALSRLQYVARDAGGRARTTVDFVMLVARCAPAAPRWPSRARAAVVEEALLVSDAAFIMGAHCRCIRRAGAGRRDLPQAARAAAKALRRVGVLQRPRPRQLPHWPSRRPTATHYHGVGAGMAMALGQASARCLPASCASSGVWRGTGSTG